MITKKAYGSVDCDSAIDVMTKALTTKYSQDDYAKSRDCSLYEGAPVASNFKREKVENTWCRAQICKVNHELSTAEIVKINLLSKSIIFIFSFSMLSF